MHKNQDDKLKNHLHQIKELKPDIIIVAGWYFMIPESILKIPKYGVWGLHSSLLQNMEEEHPWFGLKSGGKNQLVSHCLK